MHGSRIPAGLALLGLAIATGDCSRPAPRAEAAVTTPDSAEPGWRSLFDGRSADQWRAYRGDSLPAGWQVVDGALTRVATAGDIVTREQFENFELALEWKVEPGGNSGIFYRVAEAPELETVWQSGPEFQVLDDARHADGRRAETSAGACYGLYPAPRGVVRPAGEWNEARILVRRNPGRALAQWAPSRRLPARQPRLGGASRTQQVRHSAAVRPRAARPHRAAGPRGLGGVPEHQDSASRRAVGSTRASVPGGAGPSLRSG